MFEGGGAGEGGWGIRDTACRGGCVMHTDEIVKD